MSIFFASTETSEAAERISNTTPTIWAITGIAVGVVIILDLIWAWYRRNSETSLKEAAGWTLIYVSAAIIFGITMRSWESPEASTEFFAGWITEYSLSIDNLFVFMLIMSSFAVPAAYQHRVLLVGIVIALVLRGFLIVVGAELISRFSFIFYLFAAFLLFTAWKVWTADDSEEEKDVQGNALVTWVSTRFPTTNEYHGNALTATIAGRRVLTPMALVMLAIGTTDLLFAVDSIPAVFGITQQPYLVFTANAFALMGLRQLFFLLKGVLGRLVHLNKGLAIILGFIGVKLLLEALHSTTSLPVPVIPIWMSLLVIVGVLAVTAFASLRTPRGSD